MWLALHISLVFLTILRVLSRNNLSPLTRLAWFMVLILFPAFGVVVYFLFGEADLGHTANQRHNEIFASIKEKFPQVFDHKKEYKGVIEKEYQAAFQYAASINSFGLTLGNNAELMPDADTA